MDDLMSEDIRVGIMVRMRLSQMEREALARFEAEHPDKWGHAYWKRKDGSITPYGHVDSGVIEEAGGIDRIFADWELAVTPGGNRGK